LEAAKEVPVDPGTKVPDWDKVDAEAVAIGNYFLAEGQTGMFMMSS
jgi:hypothetical protein